MAIDFKKLSVLVVEDIEPMRKLIVSVLDALGVGRVLSAPTGPEGFKVFCRERPDMVISDWDMEPMTGIELTRKIRNDSLSTNRMVPIILITGYSALPRVSMARDAGVTEFIVKPFSANDLAKRIAYVINKPRDFIDSPFYFGPDRRRHDDTYYDGPERRRSDKPRNRD